MRPNGPEVQQLKRMFTDKNKRYHGFAISNDMKFFEALLGIRFVQTPAEARITPQNLQGHNWAMPYINVQLMCLNTWPFKIAGYNTQTGANNLPGLAPTVVACGSMENTYKQLSAIFLKTLELAKGCPVRDMDQRFLQFFRDMETTQFFEELKSKAGIDTKLFREITFEGEISSQKSFRGETATMQTCATAALKKFAMDCAWREGNKVKIGGVEYVIGGETSAEKNVGKPSSMLMWAYIGFAQHYSEMIGLDADRANCQMSELHRDIIRDAVYNSIPPPRYKLCNNRNNHNIESVIREFLQEHQIAFYRYCLHDLTLAFFIAIVEALSVERLARTRHYQGAKPEYLEWIREFQEHILKAFTNLIWSLPVDSNPLPEDIAISPEQYRILKEMMRLIYKSFKQYCQKIAIEKKRKIAIVMTETDL